MINPISHGSYIQQLQKYDTCKYNQNVCNNNNTDIKVPSFKESQALLAMNGILFRSSILPKETTYLYNKKTNNKESLELTNLHVYEYPDTNLQVFINEIPNKEKRDDLRVSFLLKSKNNENDSSIKKKLLMGILKESLLEHNIDANINENNTNFINIDFNNTSGINKIVILNKLVTNPQITEAQLEKSKKELIEYINLPKYEKETLELKNLINKSLFRSKDELIKEIQNITPADIYTYHSNIIKNTEAQYFITVDKNFFDNNKLAFYSALNKNISTKFQKNSNNQLIEPMYIKNPSDTQSDEFISSKNTPNNKKNNIWKWLLGGAITAALIIGLVIEKKASNAAKAEKEAAEKAKKELEEKLKKEKEELEKKLKEEQKKWDDFFKNNPTNNNKNTSSSGNSTSSSNTNGTSSSSGTAFSSTSGKKPRQSVNTESSKNTATKEMVEDAIEKTKKINERNEQLKKEIENIENEGNAEFTEEQKMTLNEYREKIEKELKNASESQSSNNITEEQTQKLKELKKIMRENYRSNVKNVYSSTFQNSSKEIQKIKNALLESNENIILFYSPDRKVGNDLIYTSAKELDYIIKTVSIDDLNKNTFESYKSLLPNTNKKII